MKIGNILVVYNQDEVLENMWKSFHESKTIHDVTWYVFLHSRIPSVMDLFHSLGRNSNVKLFDIGLNWGLSRSWNEGLLESYEKDKNDLTVQINDDLLFNKGDFDTVVEASKDDVALVTARGILHGRKDIIQWGISSITRLAYEEIGAFDENFFPAFFEDTDYELRIQLAGLKRVVVDTNIVHLGGSSSNLNKHFSHISNESMKKGDVYWKRKWGTIGRAPSGQQMREDYKTPFNKKDLSVHIPFEKRHCPYPGLNRPDMFYDVTLDNLYGKAKKESSDISEHLPIIRSYAEKCVSVGSLGTGGGIVGLLAGRPKSFVCYSSMTDMWADFVRYLSLMEGTRFDFFVSDPAGAQIEDVDLLFIDTAPHSYSQLVCQLFRNQEHVRKWILIHDTDIYRWWSEKGEQGLGYGIKKFLKLFPDWCVEKEYKNNNGLTVLKRNGLTTETIGVNEEKPIMETETIRDGIIRKTFWFDGWNGTAIEDGNRLLMVYRREGRDDIDYRFVDNWKNTDIKIGLGSGIVENKVQNLPLVFCEPKTLSLPEHQDPRLIMAFDKLWLFTSYKNHEMFIRNLEIKGNELFQNEAFHIKTIHDWKGYNKGKEKNWQPFVIGNEMFVEYSINPHRILKIDGQEARLVYETSFKETQWDSSWGSDFFLNVPPVKLSSGNWLGVFHTRTKDRYYNGFFMFSGEAPYEVLKLSCVPILYAEDSRWWNGKNSGGRHVIYIVGLWVDEENGKVILWGGDSDKKIVSYEVRLDMVMNQLVCLSK